MCFSQSPLDIITDLWSMLLSVKSDKCWISILYSDTVWIPLYVLCHMTTVSDLIIKTCDVHKDPLLLWTAVIFICLLAVSATTKDCGAGRSSSFTLI